MALYDADYEVFCESIKRREGEQEEISKTISTGQMPTSRAWDFSQWLKPTRKRADPDEETIDWRAVRGRTARTVRREGRAWKRLFSTPIEYMEVFELAIHGAGYLLPGRYDGR